MRTRDHLLLSTLAAAALYPVLGRKALVPWAASILIDVDHYAWFCLDQRTVNLVEAVRFFNQAQPPQHAATRRLHGPDVLAALTIASVWWRPLRLVVGGMAFHEALDLYHRSRQEDARTRTLLRDHYTCRVCGARDDTVVAHVWRQPRALPSYRLDTLISLCGPCHEKAHEVGAQFVQYALASADTPTAKASPA